MSDNITDLCRQLSKARDEVSAVIVLANRCREFTLAADAQRVAERYRHEMNRIIDTANSRRSRDNATD